VLVTVHSAVCCGLGMLGYTFECGPHDVEVGSIAGRQSVWPSLKPTRRMPAPRSCSEANPQDARAPFLANKSIVDLYFV
jgi:hypothetical protein